MLCVQSQWYKILNLNAYAVVLRVRKRLIEALYRIKAYLVALSPNIDIA